MSDAAVTPSPEIVGLVSDLKDLGVTRVHCVAWRDLDDPEAGGSEVHADNIFRRWAAAGLQIHQRTSTAKGPREIQRHGYRITQRGGRYTVFAREILRQIFRRHRYDAVIEIWNGVPWFSSVWARRPRVTWMHHLHTDMWEESLPGILAPLGPILESRIAPPFYKRSPLITLAEPTREILVEQGYSPRFVHVIPPGIGPEFLCSPEVPKASHPTIIAVGRLAPVKQFSELIKVASILAVDIPQLRLVIVGEGPEKTALEHLIEELDCSRLVTLAGRVSQEQLVSLYQSSWILASASHSEGWGMTITEAAACGTPSVALLNDGHRAAIIDGISGLLVRDFDEMAEKISTLLRDDVKRESLALAAHERARHFTWENAAEQSLRILLDEVRRSRR